MTEQSEPNKEKENESALTPLKSSTVFRSLWIANTASNIGTWIQDVGGAWFMTSLTTSSFHISLMQAATTFPLFLLALPSGVGADLFDRRKLLVFTTSWIAASAILLGFLILFGLRSPNFLLLLTFVLNLGAALFVPTWQASIPEMVPKEHLSGAFALNSASLNVARAIGPAIGGFLLVAIGPWANYFVNALTCIVLVCLLLLWKRPKTEQSLPPEQFIGAMRAGIRYVRHSSTVKAILVRALAFIIPASALFALLPILVKKELHMGASAFGMLLGCVGIGALTGVYFLPKFRTKYSFNQLVMGASLLLATAILGLAFAKELMVLSMLMLIAGLAWLLSLSSFNVSIMGSVPSWVRGRAGAVYLLVFYGGMSAGAILWGILADQLGIISTLMIASMSLATGVFLAIRFRIPQISMLNLAPSVRWAEPVVIRQINAYDQAVMVTPKGLCLPSAFGINTLRTDFAR